MLPVVQRELLIAARQPSLFRARLVAAAVGVAVGGFGMLRGVSAGSGKSLFLWMVGLALLASLIEGLRKAASCIADEREQGTLGLLFLTDLRGYDVVLGKLAAIAIRSLHGLLAFFPVLAIAVLLGGVTSGELVRSAGVLISALVLSLCIGIFASVWSPNGGRASIYTILMLCGLALLGPLADNLSKVNGLHGLSIVSLVSPVRISVLATQFSYNSQTGDFWLGLGLQFLVSIGLLALSSWMLPRRLQEQSARGIRLPGWVARVASISWIQSRVARTSALLLDTNPLQWLAWRNQGNRVVAGLLSAAIVMVGGLLMLVDFDAALFLAFPAAIAIRLWTVFLSVQAGLSLHQNEAMELMLVTPIDRMEAIKTIDRGVWRVVKGPYLALCSVAVFWGLCEVIFGNAIGFEPIGSVIFLGIQALGLHASIRVGIWGGLAEKTFGRAFILTLIRTIFAPMLLCCWGIVPADLIWIAVGARKIQEHFRKRILDHYTGGSTLAGSLPPRPLGSGPPPVIQQPGSSSIAK